MINTQNVTISNLEGELEDVGGRKAELEDEIGVLRKLNEAVRVIDSNGIYHMYGCEEVGDGVIWIYEKEQVTIRLLANGVDSGRTETVSLKNEWTAVFNGLPYLDEAGNIIVYTVVESWETEDWSPTYGAISVVGSGDVPTYTTTITNTYIWTNTTELPSTGGSGPLIYILCGLILVGAPLVYGFSLRRKNGRRSKR